MMQAGWRIEYSAIAHARTSAPETLTEFYKQRKRWSPSTIAHNLDLIFNRRSLMKGNNSISM